MSALKTTWGASLRLNTNFRGRAPLLTGVRELVLELCAQCLAPGERSSMLVMAVQELAENLVKYSQGESSLSFELGLLQDQAVARICTLNTASPEHLMEATEIFSRISGAADITSLYDKMVAASGDREGSRLGLIRIRAEAGLALSCTADSERLSITATGPVEPK